MGAKRKFSGQNAQITENQSGGCPPATAHSESIEVSSRYTDVTGLGEPNSGAAPRRLPFPRSIGIAIGNTSAFSPLNLFVPCIGLEEDRNRGGVGF